MEDDKSHVGGSSSNSGICNLEMNKAERAVWLMKCPLVVAKSWQSHSSDPNPVAKVVLSVDPLLPPGDPDSVQFTMELAGNDNQNMPKNYALNTFRDIVPMCIFSETNQ
ncbi:hypothetical protein MKW94_001842, partial [Papaver nudicaule]|nr:hypothetical protein [Papaver nudicaule]